MNHRRVTLTLALVLALVMGAYVTWPRHAELRGFEPAEIARLETAMWRDYYENRYPVLFYHLYELSRLRRAYRSLKAAEAGC